MRSPHRRNPSSFAMRRAEGHFGRSRDQGLGSEIRAVHPIVYQGKWRPLYLECALVAFTRERIEGIALLTGQIAVSLKHAELYEQLEQRVDERTQQLGCATGSSVRHLAMPLDDVAAALWSRPKGDPRRRAPRSRFIAGPAWLPAAHRPAPPEHIVSIVNNFLGRDDRSDLSESGNDQRRSSARFWRSLAHRSTWPIMRNAGRLRAGDAIAMDRVNVVTGRSGCPVEMGVSLHSRRVVVGNVAPSARNTALLAVRSM